MTFNAIPLLIGIVSLTDKQDYSHGHHLNRETSPQETERQFTSLLCPGFSLLENTSSAVFLIYVSDNEATTCLHCTGEKGFNFKVGSSAPA
ncbi:hypothetical protein BaRGS_00009971 [Batillaria attramentaria]|uniref:Secreted protein n=1 Tax=Batillaria attramentaria TaxID=370345 RepID=A0ABD0LIR1_9CAEN